MHDVRPILLLKEGASASLAHPSPHYAVLTVLGLHGFFSALIINRFIDLFPSPSIYRFFMTISHTLGKFAPAQIQGPTPGSDEVSLTQLKEIEDVIPSIQCSRTTITEREGHVAKPWAHFVAGGYLLSLKMLSMKEVTDLY